MIIIIHVCVCDFLLRTSTFLVSWSSSSPICIRANCTENSTTAPIQPLILLCNWNTTQDMKTPKTMIQAKSQPSHLNRRSRNWLHLRIVTRFLIKTNYKSVTFFSQEGVAVFGGAFLFSLNCCTINFLGLWPFAFCLSLYLKWKKNFDLKFQGLFRKHLTIQIL